jgi:hypothetical protein
VNSGDSILNFEIQGNPPYFLLPSIIIYANSQRLSAFAQNFDILIVTEQAASPLSGQFPGYALFLQHMK